MIQFIKEIFAFYKNPTDTRIDHYSVKKNAAYIAYAFLANTLLLIIFLPILFYMADQLKDTSFLVYEHDTLKFTLLYYVLIIPVIEEIIFRLPLRYNRLYAVFLSREKWNKLFKVLVYLLPLSFGLVHISNYDLQSAGTLVLLLTPLAVLSQIAGGFLLTFLRVKFNLLSSITSHMIWNLLMGVCLAFGESYFDKKYIQSEKEYEIKIESNAFSDLTAQKLTVDSANQKIYSVESSHLSINHVLDSLAQFIRNDEDYSINLSLKSKNGITKKQFIKIMADYDKCKE